MLFDWNTIAFPASVQDLQLSAPLTLSGEGLWVCLVSSGQCSASVPAAGPLPLGAALILPPQSVPAGHLILSRAPLALVPESICHLLCVQLTGQAASQFLAGLHELPFLAKGGSCPAAAELMDRLAEEKTAHSRARSQLAYALLCELADADSAASALPPLVQAAIEDIRANYANGWACPRAIWCAPLPPPLACRRANTSPRCALKQPSGCCSTGSTHWTW